MSALLTLGSVLLAGANLVSTAAISRKQRWGWWLSLSSTLAGIPYDIVTRQYGFVLTGASSLWFMARALRTWRTAEGTAP